MPSPQDMTPRQLAQFLNDFETKGYARNPNLPDPPQRTWGFNGIGLNPKMSVNSAVLSAWQRYGKPIEGNK